jgi:hypothetical protein
MKKTTTIILFLLTSITITVNAQSSPKSQINPQLKIPTSDFPHLVNTGNNIEDETNYALAKENWISQNPRSYEAIMNATSVDVLPGFPQKNKTGNPETDDAAFKIAKDKWYQDYPEMLKLFYENNAKKYTPKFDKN